MRKTKAVGTLRAPDVDSYLDSPLWYWSLSVLAPELGIPHIRPEGRLAKKNERNSGSSPATGERVADPFLAKIEEWVERSRGRVSADVCHGKLVAMGYVGSERSTRRAVAEAQRGWRAGNRRVYRPWVPEPGLWC
jgi:hypothetical protein